MNFVDLQPGMKFTFVDIEDEGEFEAVSYPIPMTDDYADPATFPDISQETLDEAKTWFKLHAKRANDDLKNELIGSYDMNICLVD